VNEIREATANCSGCAIALSALPSKDEFVQQSGIFLSLVLASCCLSAPAAAQQKKTASAEYMTVTDLSYRNGDDLTDYMKERCRLDVYYPKNGQNFSTVVWFHGGGLTGGKKSVPKQLQEKGIAVVAVNYRLHPKVKSPAYVEDAAAAVAWTIRNIETYGGSAEKVFVSGHSAGGYLTSMVGLDKRWLAAFNIDANSIAGLIPFSGHTITHFTVRKEHGIDGKQPVIDDMAPLYHVRNDAPPLLIITGDRELEMLGRYEENAYLWRMMQVVEHPDTEIYELDGYNHGQMAEPAHPLLLRFMKKHSDSRK
jgi:acetyl esterase/lipase